MAAVGPLLQARIAYEDEYVNPLILCVLSSRLSRGALSLVRELPSSFGETVPRPYLEWAAYETLDFERALAAAPGTALVNAYVIRKALIRKHFLSQIISSWCTKNPESPLKHHFEPATEFELDYAEFLDDALVEAWDLRASFERNEGKSAAEREWWILKPGMSDRGQGIRLFSSEDELAAIFEQWEAENPSDDEEDTANDGGDGKGDGNGEGIITSQLRHFLAQPYIHPPLLIPHSPFNNRKFHIRTYIVAYGALKVWVYRHMLALFASEPYAPPWELAECEKEEDRADGLLQSMRNIHLTNTCVQSDTSSDGVNTRDSVHLVSDLPLAKDTISNIEEQICTTTSELFHAALAHPTHFQPLPNSFEVFGLDFLVSRDNKAPGGVLTASLLEVNAFPDFAQTGERLRDVVIKGLMESIAQEVIAPHFGIQELATDKSSDHKLCTILDLNMGRR